jgi:hypothetical protein
MALYLNFYHEIKSQKIQQQRDPLKIGMAVLALFAAIFLLIYLWRATQVGVLARKVANRNGEWAAIAPKLDEARNRKLNTDPSIKAAETIIQRIENRIFWAPILQMLLEQTPPHVQLTRTIFETVGEERDRIRLQLSGVIAGKEPRIEADAFRTKLEQVFGARFPEVKAAFAQLDDRSEEIALNGASLKTATLIIEFEFGVPKPEPADPAASPTPGSNP